MSSSWKRIALAMALGSAFAGLATVGRADPLLRQGIGLQTCDKLAAQLKPGGGLDHLPNALLFYWFQGYISAANIALVEADAKHVDMGQLDENRVLNLLLTFCKANPDKQPLGALNDYLRKTAKVRIKWEKGTIDWNQ